MLLYIYIYIYISTEESKKNNAAQNVVQDVATKSLLEGIKLIKLEVEDGNISRLQSYQEIIKTKHNAIRTIEKETLNPKLSL